ncbi:MAG TPA: hypothetical protein VN155_16925 [Devosia sp.]|nr:hypothetical protein [Devosia sp.]
MRRRGVLGLLAGSAVAGPQMAKTAIASGMEGLSLSGAGMLGGSFGGYSTMDSIPTGGGNYDPTEWPRKELADFLGRSMEEKRRRRLETHVNQLDPDIVVMNSLSLTTKVRMQRDRNFERAEAEQRGYLERQLRNALEHLTT